MNEEVKEYISALDRRAANCRTVSNLDTTRAADANDLQIEAWAIEWAAQLAREKFARWVPS